MAILRGSCLHKKICGKHKAKRGDVYYWMFPHKKLKEKKR